MPKERYERHEPTHDWQQLRPLIKDPTQVTYEIIRPVILGWETPKERAATTDMPQRTIYYKTTLFDQTGMASLLPPTPPPKVPKLDKRNLPPPMRQAIVDLKAEYPAFTLHEIATICYAQFGRRPSPHTIQVVLASGPRPSRTQRRYPLYAAFDDPIQARIAIIRLHAEGWSVSSIARYLEISRKHVYTILRRWVEEQFAGLADKPSRPHQPATKVTLTAMNEVKKLQVNPELGEYRMSAALEQLGIKLSPRTRGRILALNRDLYHLQVSHKGSGRPKKEPPFKAEKRHQYWSVDIRYLDMHKLGGGNIYCISVLENYSRAILASAVSREQDSKAFLSVLYAAIRKHGCPETLVSDSGSVFLSDDSMRVYQALGIHKEQIQKGRPWQNYIETCFNVQRRMADWHFETAQTWQDLLAAHKKWLLDYNYQKHFAHEKREDGRHSPAEVLGWVSGTHWEPEHVYRAFAAICEIRRLNKAGYVRFRNFQLYADLGLAGKRARINIFQDILTLEYGEYPLAKYSVEWQPDDKHLLRVGNPGLFDHPYQSLQQSFWSPEEVEWFLILKCETAPRRRKRKQGIILQLLLVFEPDGTQG